MFQLPPPPVPLTLREMLKDYPELIEELQEVLNKIVTTPPKGIPLFEWAIWRLEDTLSAFISDARRELEVAKQDGTPEAIHHADQKYRLMLASRSGNVGMQRLDDLWTYFQEHQGAFE